MMKKTTRSLVGLMVTSLLFIPTQKAGISKRIEQISAIAMAGTIPVANWAELNKELKNTKKATVLKILADISRLANEISSIDYNAYSFKYNIAWTAFDAEQLIEHICGLFDIQKTPSLPTPNTPETLTEANIDEQLSQLSYTLRVVALPIVEAGLALYSSMYANTTTPNGLKWDAAVNGIKSLIRLTSDYTIVKKASIQEKIYIGLMICNVLLCVYDFATVEEKATKKAVRQEALKEGKSEIDFLKKKYETSIKKCKDKQRIINEFEIFLKHKNDLLHNKKYEFIADDLNEYFNEITNKDFEKIENLRVDLKHEKEHVQLQDALQKVENLLKSYAEANNKENREIIKKQFDKIFEENKNLSVFSPFSGRYNSSFLDAYEDFIYSFIYLEDNNARPPFLTLDVYSSIEKIISDRNAKHEQAF